MTKKNKEKKTPTHTLPEDRSYTADHSYPGRNGDIYISVHPSGQIKGYCHQA